MKVALLITGFMRDWKSHFPYFQNIIKTYDADVFITSYTHSQATLNENFIQIDIDEVIRSYNPTNYLFRDTESIQPFIFKENGREQNGREWSIRIIEAWYNMYQSLSLFNPDDYDVILKIRSDMSIKNLNIDFSKELVIPAWRWHPGPCEPEVSFANQFTYGNKETMVQFLSLYTHLQEMHMKDLCDVSLDETLIFDYVKNYIGLNKVSFDYQADWFLPHIEMWASEHPHRFT